MNTFCFVLCYALTTSSSLFSVTPVAEIVFDAAPTHKTADELIGISSIFFNLYKDPLSTQSLVVPAITDTDRSRPAVRFRDVVILGAVGDARGNPVEFVGFKDGAFVNGWPAITTLQQLNTIPSLARSQDGRLIVTDDSIMTELILAVGMQVFLRMTQPRKTQVSDLMRMIAVATLVNAQWGLDRSFYLKWAGARPHASFAEVDYVPGYSWITSSRAPGMACINALKYYVEECIKGNHNFAWDRSRNKNRFIGREGGCGKIMDAAAFGLLFWQQPAVAAQLSALHSCISHPDIVSQVACGAYSYAIAEGIKGGSLNKIVLGMIRYAKQFSYNNARQEQTEWLLTPVAYRGKRGDKPFTVAQRIILARAAALKKVSPDIFFAKNTGFGAPDFIASVVFTAYWALQNKATISDAMNCCINTTASTDRDSLAAGVGRFLGSCKEFESGVNGAELAFLERHGDREKFAALCATWAQLL